jgi:hypothetical protein
MNVEVSRIGNKPLVANLDGTLVRADLQIESLFAHLGANPVRLLSLPFARCRGWARFNAEIARQTSIDAAHLPYDERVLSHIRDARASGRRVYLASTGNEHDVRQVALHHHRSSVVDDA